MTRERVGIRDLRNRGGDVLDRVERGQSLIVTRSGRPIAELRPLSKVRIDRKALLHRWRHLPTVDFDGLRRDISAVLDEEV